jgi:Carboxypeptidase regulatory-like domain
MRNLQTLNVLAQGTNDTLSETAADLCEPPFPGATLTAHDIKTGVSHNTVSNDSDVYPCANLQPGTAQVSVEVPGFRKLVFNEVTSGSRRPHQPESAALK